MTDNRVVATKVMRIEPRLAYPPGSRRDPIAESTRASLEALERTRSAGNERIEAIVADALRDLTQAQDRRDVEIERPHRGYPYWAIYDFALCHGPAFLALL
ncbi:UNVERIFIED_ORG: hypothetical protein EDC92_1431 [Dietzia maris]|uniref:hypothetical protein n=1 Tax=Dietzia maris TaxID=37915 RepID=UPI0010540611